MMEMWKPLMAKGQYMQPWDTRTKTSNKTMLNSHVQAPPPRAYLDAVLGLSSPHLSEMKPTGSSPLNDPVMAGD